MITTSTGIKAAFLAFVLGSFLVGSLRSRRESYAPRDWVAFLARLALAIGALTLTGLMAAAVDDGFTKDWAWTGRAGWVSGMFALGGFGIWTLVSTIIDSDRQPSLVLLWKPLVICLGVGAFSFGLIALDRTGLLSLPRIFLFLAGGTIIAFTFFKPTWFWDHPQATWLRDNIGDWATASLYYGLGFLLVAVAIFGDPAAFLD